MTTDYDYDPMDLHFLDPANRTSMGSHIDGKCLFFTARDRIHSASQPEPVDASNTQQTRLKHPSIAKLQSMDTLESQVRDFTRPNL